MNQILTWSATCCMWRVEKISKWEDKKKFIALPCAKKNTRQTMTLPCALVLPCVFLSTLGKNHVCRVPVNLHTANYGAHGKIEVSGSEALKHRRMNHPRIARRTRCLYSMFIYLPMPNIFIQLRLRSWYIVNLCIFDDYVFLGKKSNLLPSCIAKIWITP